jgi:hypothetical protein
VIEHHRQASQGNSLKHLINSGTRPAERLHARSAAFNAAVQVDLAPMQETLVIEIHMLNF